MTAHLVQDWVDKVWECRVVVVGDEMFAVAIHADSPEAYVDWRSDYEALSCEVFDLPADVAQGVRGVMAELGLVYGAFDMSVSRSGGRDRFSFLEINPGGHYGFLEAAAGIPVTDRLTSLLIRGGES